MASSAATVADVEYMHLGGRIFVSPKSPEAVGAWPVLGDLFYHAGRFMWFHLGADKRMPLVYVALRVRSAPAGPLAKLAWSTPGLRALLGAGGIFAGDVRGGEFLCGLSRTAPPSAWNAARTYHAALRSSESATPILSAAAERYLKRVRDEHPAIHAAFSGAVGPSFIARTSAAYNGLSDEQREALRALVAARPLTIVTAAACRGGAR